MTRSSFLKSYKDLVARLIDARVAAGITQTQLAERLGRPQPFVSKYERGNRRLDVIEFLSICVAIGVDPAAILDEVMATFELGAI